MGFIKIMRTGEKDPVDATLKIITSDPDECYTEEYINIDFIAKARYIAKSEIFPPHFTLEFIDKTSVGYKCQDDSDTEKLWRTDIVPKLYYGRSC